jgi:hypothetical protein
VDVSSFDKALKHNPGYGYEPRKAAPSSIVVHSTSSSTRNTAFSAEATFLYNASLVSAHYLIGREGQIVRFLDPKVWAAWHAGAAQAAWSNQKSIGIELHHSVGDDPYPKAQLLSLAALLKSLMALFTIPVEMIETHGQIALPGPYDRKRDPSDLPYEAFLQFRSALAPAPPPPSPVAPVPYVVRGLPVYERSDRTGALWGHLVTGGQVVIDDPTNGHLADGRGFVDMKGLLRYD